MHAATRAPQALKNLMFSMHDEHSEDEVDQIMMGNSLFMSICTQSEPQRVHTPNPEPS